MEELLALLLSTIMFALITAVLAFTFSLGFAQAFGIAANFYGIWILFVTMALFSIIFDNKS